MTDTSDALNETASKAKTDYVDRLTRRVGGALAVITILGFVSIIATIAIYRRSFGSELSNDDEHWARFGEFVGGTLNPALSFFAFLALVITLWVQIQGMRLSRIGLEDARQEISRQQKALHDSDAKKRRFVFALLKDEIELRWKSKMSIDLSEIVALSKENPLEAAKIFINDVGSSLDDLIVCKLVCTSFSDFYFIEDPHLMSEIIHGHVLMRDFIDFRVAVKRDLDNEKFDAIPNYFHSTLSHLVDSMNERYSSISARIP